MKEFIKNHKFIMIFVIVFIIILIGVFLFIFLEKKIDVIPSEKYNFKKTEFEMSYEEQNKNIIDKYLYDSHDIVIENYDNLRKYPEAYNGVMIRFDAKIIKIVEEKDDNYKIKIQFNIYDESETPQYIMIEGKYNNGVRYLENVDYYTVRGIFRGMETYTIDGSTEVLPKVEVDCIAAQEGISVPDEYSKSEIRNIANEFFMDQTFTLNKNKADQLIITLDNSSNSKFKEFKMYSQFGHTSYGIESTDNSNEVSTYVRKTSDNKSYLLMRVLPNLNRVEVQSFDKDFKLIWSREFKESINNRFNWENNNGRVTISISGNLYYIDENSGKDIIDPIITGESLNHKLLKNGDVIFASKRANDFIMYLDSKGKIKWKYSINKDPLYASIVVVNNKIYVNLGTATNYDEEDYIDHQLVLSRDGKKIISTF